MPALVKNWPYSWIEIFSNGSLATKCEKELKKDPIKVPSLVRYEVYKKIKKSASEDLALEAISLLSKYEVLDITQEVALSAADLSIEYEIGMADSLMLAFAVNHKDLLLTFDNDFAGIPNTKIIRTKA